MSSVQGMSRSACRNVTCANLYAIGCGHTGASIAFRRTEWAAALEVTRHVEALCAMLGEHASILTCYEAFWQNILELPGESVSDVPEVRWDKLSLLIDGKRVCPVMGEIHYSRVPSNEWADEVRKMKQCGVTIIATYVFWNHVEEHEGVFDWSGQRNLRRFIEVCKEEGMPVVLRVGPFCHGEARNGIRWSRCCRADKR